MANITPYHRPAAESKKTVLVTLVKELRRFYLEETVGDGGRFRSEDELRKYMNEHYKGWWFTVYPETSRKELEDHGLKGLNEDQLLEVMADLNLS